MDDNQTIKQQKIAFAQSEHTEAAIQLLRETIAPKPLVGDNEYSTIVNAVTLDAQSEMINKFIQAIVAIKNGSLHQKP